MIIRRALLETLSDDGLVLQCSIRPVLRVPTGPDEIWEARLAVLGNFESNVWLSRETAEWWAREAALYVLWPFARSMMDQLARLSSVSATPLPLIVRPGDVILHE